MFVRLIMICMCAVALGLGCGKKDEAPAQPEGAGADALDESALSPVVSAMTAPAPRVEAVHVYESVEALRAACQAAATDIRARLAALETFAGAPTLDSIYKPYNEMALALANAWQETNLLQEAHPQELMRKAADRCDSEFSDVLTEISLSRPLYDRIVMIDTAGADEATKFSVFKTLRDFRRVGVDRDEATRERIRELIAEDTRISQEFNQVLREDVRHILLDDVKGLAGLPEDYIEAHAPGSDGKIKITTDDPDYMPFMSYAQDDEARKALRIAFNTRGHPANDNHLKDLLKTRFELARTLGYPDYAAYVTEDKMIQSPAKAQAFIDDIDAIVKEAVQRDLSLLLERLREIDPAATEVGAWQEPYLRELIRREDYAVDSQELRSYFRFANVKAGLLKLAEEQFGVTISDWATPVWYPDVSAHEIRLDGKLIGRFYLDLHPRTGKFKHAAEFPVATGIEGEQVPIAALVANLPGAEDPTAALEHDDVVTLLHELGHLLHHVLGGHARWVNNSGVATEWDFAEAPSQLLENWAYDYESLKRFAVNAKGEMIPRDLVERLNRAREFGLGLDSASDAFAAALSLAYYRGDPASFELLPKMIEMQERYAPLPYTEGTFFYDRFTHLDGYSAVYYTYLWSLAIAEDMFTRFEAEGLNSPEVSLAYRKAVLEPGGSAPAAELVQSFLGRPWSTEAYRVRLNRAP